MAESVLGFLMLNILGTGPMSYRIELDTDVEDISLVKMVLGDALELLEDDNYDVAEDSEPIVDSSRGNN